MFLITPNPKGFENIKEEDMMTLNDIEIVARTRIELDGDVCTILKGTNSQTAQISEDLMTLHKEGIEISMKNWRLFLETVVDVSKTLATLAK